VEAQVKTTKKPDDADGKLRVSVGEQEG
jgi:hypothetical protein